MSHGGEVPQPLPTFFIPPPQAQGPRSRLRVLCTGVPPCGRGQSGPYLLAAVTLLGPSPSPWGAAGAMKWPPDPYLALLRPSEHLSVTDCSRATSSSRCLAVGPHPLVAMVLLGLPQLAPKVFLPQKEH